MNVGRNITAAETDMIRSVDAPSFSSGSISSQETAKDDCVRVAGETEPDITRRFLSA
jgi:hypothetical protein